ncbi:hypothetical protein HYT74_03235 [Candidatus Daviesbacteria bacterium]|nr:hypothetical protein [Candidatus Daviesbacteria bacterium]
MWKRRKSRQLKVAGILKYFFIAFLFLIIIIVSLVLKDKLFIIRQIEVKADQAGCVSLDQLKNTSSLLGKNLFVMDEKKVIKNLLEKFICVKEVNLVKILPNKVEMKVTGRAPAAILSSLKTKPASASSLIANIATPSAQDISDVFIVDSEGVIFSKDTGGINIPNIYLYDLSLSLGKKLKENFISNILKILDKVKLFGTVVKESWVSEDTFLIYSDTPPFKIVFRLDNKVDFQLASLQLILAEAKIYSRELEFIDLRFDKPVVKIAPKK